MSIIDIGVNLSNWITHNITALGPLTKLTVTTGIAGAAGYTALEKLYYKRRAEKDMQYIRIFPHAETPFNETAILHLVNGFYHAKRPQVEKMAARQGMVPVLLCLRFR